LDSVNRIFSEAVALTRIEKNLDSSHFYIHGDMDKRTI